MNRTHLAFLLCLTLVVGTALADDIETPPWLRTSDRATFQRWEFSDNNPMPFPNEEDNRFGPPQLTVWPLVGSAWMGEYDNRYGVWPLSGEIEVRIPNAKDHPEWTKRVQIQLTWELEGQILPLVTVDDIDGQEIETDVIGGGLPEHPWFHTTWLVELPYNPVWELVSISGDIMVDELVIDTICVPEPGTMALLAIGGVMALARRRRR